MGHAVTKLESRGTIEARKLKPKIENAKRVMIETVIEIGKQYNRLGDSDKADFRNELGLSAVDARRYVSISKNYLDRAKALGRSADDHPLEKTVTYAAEISQLSRENFDRIKNNVTLSSTSKEVRRAVADASPLRQKLTVAARAINAASGHVNAIRCLMEKDGITEIRGPEVRILRKEFELLCAELAVTDPGTMEQARKVLRGEI